MKGTLKILADMQKLPEGDFAFRKEVICQEIELRLLIMLVSVCDLLFYEFKKPLFLLKRHVLVVLY